MSFVHLHNHSEYSLLEASLRVKGLAKKASEFGQSAVALTDNGNMFGAIEFYFACKDKGVKPILGMDIYLAPNGHLVKGSDRDQISKPNTRMVLLAENIQGYRELCQISTVGFQDGFYYKPRVDEGVLAAKCKNIIALSGGLRGDIVQTFLTQGPELALEKIRKFQKIFPEKFYLEINRTGLPEWKKINEFLIEASKITGAPLVAANDVHYLTRDDQLPQEVLICIGSNKTLSDDSRFKLGSDQFYFKSSEDMRALFKDIPGACDNTLEIASRCDVKFKMKDDNGKPIYHLPSYPTSEGRSLKDEMRRQALDGLEKRFVEAAGRNETVPEEKKPSYFERIDFELNIIDRMGFNGYFLIVADFIKWAKEHGIPVGPGRGSGAGSLVAFSLMITDLDPLPYNLLFERFLNPERISMPDFDIDFCQDRRQEVIQYVTEKYGAGSVSQIITYGKLQTRAAIKDVGRVLGMTFPEVDAVTKLIPDKLNVTIEESLEMEPKIREQMEMNPTINTLIDLSLRIEGLVRHAGIHAAGVIIADGNLVDHAPLYKGSEGENVVQYDMKHAEKIGLIKFDFLGLKTLTHIDRALKLIERNRGVKKLPQDISLSDPGIYEIMSKGDTAGIFQFEGEGITDAIRKIRPSNFGDITAINALYRPGPMAMIPDFAKRKHGESQVEYLFDELKSVLEETYGIIVYQEQVMAIASQIAGYSLGEADMLRRAMGKKIKEEMDQHRIRFLKGASEKGFETKKSEELFELMYKFADYGFNKSHAAAYCVVAAQTAWLKNYYPAEFFAALLSTELGDTDKVVRYVKDAQKRGLKVLPPHVNFSEYLFTVKGDDVYFGLGGIKGVGEIAINAIVEAREKLPSKQFASVEEFFASVDTKKLNKKVIECLIKAGAFDGFGYHRAQLIAGYQKFLDVAELKRKEAEVGQSSLFDLAEVDQTKIVLDNTQPWNRTASLAFEKEVLGFYLSDHPLKGYEVMSRLWTSGSVQEVNVMEPAAADQQTAENKNPKARFFDRTPKKRVVVSGLLADFREVITKKGTRMAFGKIEDLTGAIEVVIFPDSFAQFEGILKSEKPLLVGGGFERSEGGSAKILLDSAAILEDSFNRIRSMTLKLHKVSEEDFPRLLQLLNEHPGETSVGFVMEIPELKKQVEIDVEGVRGVRMDPSLLEDLQTQFGRTDFLELR